MISLKAGNKRFLLIIGRITTDSYSATIKKLAMAQRRGFAQIVPARLIAGKKHLAAALEAATSAMRFKSNFAKTLNLEFLIRLFGEKQLGRAIEKAGFKDREPIVLIAEGGAEKLAALKKEIGISETKYRFGDSKEGLMRAYGVSQEELGAVSDLKNALEALVIEKISFVAMER